MKKAKGGLIVCEYVLDHFSLKFLRCTVEGQERQELLRMIGTNRGIVAAHAEFFLASDYSALALCQLYLLLPEHIACFDAKPHNSYWCP